MAIQQLHLVLLHSHLQTTVVAEGANHRFRIRMKCRMQPKATEHGNHRAPFRYIDCQRRQDLESEYDRVVLDMLAPWECIDIAARALRPGGVFLAYVATTTQLSATAEALKEDGRFTEPESSETLVRGWHHEGLAVRPQQRMIGHTGFLIQSRRMAPGVEVLARRRRPAKGAYGVSED